VGAVVGSSTSVRAQGGSLHGAAVQCVRFCDRLYTNWGIFFRVLKHYWVFSVSLGLCGNPGGIKGVLFALKSI